MEITGEEFRLSKDRGVVFVTVLVLVILLGVTAMFAINALRGGEHSGLPPASSAGLGFLPVAILLAVAAYTPRSYVVDGREIRVRRYAPDVHIPLNAIRSIESIERRDLGRVWRVAGNGGFLGHVGWFHSSTLKTVRMYVTRFDRLVVIRLTKGLPILLSPDDRERFLAAVRSRSAGLADSAQSTLSSSTD